MRHADKGDFFDVDIPLAQAKPEEFDALVQPGGLMNSDELRSTPAAVEFVRAFGETGIRACGPNFRAGSRRRRPPDQPP
jgi:protease I